MLCLLWGVTVKGACFSFVNSTPGNGENISKFEFTLHFDIEEAKENLPEKAAMLGIGCSGTRRQCTKLYKGDIADGEQIGTALTSGVNGTSDDFIVGSGDFKFSFPGLAPEPGQLYTLEISNSFYVLEGGTSVGLGADYTINYKTNPIILTFTGTAAASDELILLGTSLEPNNEYEEIDKVKLHYNFPVQFVDAANLDAFGFYLDDKPYCTPATIEIEDETTVVLNFENAVFFKTNTYEFVASANAVCLKSNQAVTNIEYSAKIKGATYKYYEVAGISPASDFNGVLGLVDVSFNLPDKATFPGNIGSTPRNYPASLYKVSGNDLELVGTLAGVPDEINGQSISWEINCELLPMQRYLFKIAKGSILAYLYDTTSLSGYKLISDTSNDDIEIYFTTPSIENSGLPEMEFGAPYKADTDGYNRVEYPEGSKVDFLPVLYFEPKERYYLYNDASYELLRNKEIENAVLYKTAENGDRVKIKDVKLGSMVFYTAEDRYIAGSLSVNSRLYEGEKYQIVIPAGAFTVNNKALQNFVTSDEIVMTFEGTSASTLSLACASLRDGERMSSISSVTFLSDQELMLADPAARLTLKATDGSGSTFVSEYMVGTVTYDIKQETGHTLKQTFTKIMGDFSSPLDMAPRMLPEEADEYQVVVAAGTFALANDPDIRNGEIVVNIKRVPQTGLPEYVTLTSVVNAHASTLLPIEKGLKAKLQLTPSEDWTIEKVVFNGKEVTGNVGEDGTYETPAVRIDSRLEVHLAFNGDLFFEDATGVASIPDTRIRAYSEGEHIVVEGLGTGDVVDLYTLAGVKLDSHTATADIVKVSAPAGRVYIVGIVPADGGRKAAMKLAH